MVERKMNILGINGSIGWDGNINMISTHMDDMWVHGSGATLFIDGELRGSLSEERLTRIKYDGNYPLNTINNLLERNNLSPDDINVVAYVGSPTNMSLYLREGGYTEGTLSNIFKNAEIKLIDHHLAHGAGSFLSSGFESANIYTFDGAGDIFRFPPDNTTLRGNNSRFFNGDFNKKTIDSIYSTHLPTSQLGRFFSNLSWVIYNLKVKGDNKDDDAWKWYDPISRESYPGKIMGLSAYGDASNVKYDNYFEIEFEESAVLAISTEDGDPIIMDANTDLDGISQYEPEDLAAWVQEQFQRILLQFFENIPKEIKKDKLCLGGGCALNILANSAILENGIYEDVHVNTAPNDDGLSFGGAILVAFEKEKDLILPDNMGCIGFDYNEMDIQETISKFEMDRL